MSPAPAQIPPCPHRPPCPGCPRYGEPGIASAARERLEALCRERGLPPLRVLEGPAQGFRHRARLAVRGRAGSPKIGIFQAGSHRITDIPECRVHHPLVNRVAAALRSAVRETATRPYAERPHRGDLRALQVVVERASQRAQVVLVGNAADPEPLRPLAAALAARLGPDLHSLFWNGNPDRSNVVLGPHWQRLAGPEAVCERIGGVEVFFPPDAFGQSHLTLADVLVAEVHGRVPERRRVLELYAGSGPIGLGLLARSRSVALNESAPGGLRGLALGLAARPEVERRRARILPGAAAEAAAAVREAEIVIADPPRKGLDPALQDALCGTPPDRFLYVSCDLGSFLAQAAALEARSPLRLRELLAFALFPFTDHVETLALFTPG